MYFFFLKPSLNIKAAANLAETLPPNFKLKFQPMNPWPDYNNTKVELLNN